MNDFFASMVDLPPETRNASFPPDAYSTADGSSDAFPCGMPSLLEQTRRGNLVTQHQEAKYTRRAKRLIDALGGACAEAEALQEMIAELIGIRPLATCPELPDPQADHGRILSAAVEVVRYLAADLATQRRRFVALKELAAQAEEQRFAAEQQVLALLTEQSGRGIDPVVDEQVALAAMLTDTTEQMPTQTGRIRRLREAGSVLEDLVIDLRDQLVAAQAREQALLDRLRHVYCTRHGLTSGQLSTLPVSSTLLVTELMSGPLLGDLRPVSGLLKQAIAKDQVLRQRCAPTLPVADDAEAQLQWITSTVGMLVTRVEELTALVPNQSIDHPFLAAEPPMVRLQHDTSTHPAEDLDLALEPRQTSQDAPAPALDDIAQLGETALAGLTEAQQQRNHADAVLTEQITRLTAIAQDRNTQLNHTRQVLSEREADLDEVQARLAAMLARTGEEATNLRSNLSQARKEIATLGQELAGHRDRLAAAEAALANERTELSRRLTERDAELAQKDHDLDARADARGNTAALEAELAQVYQHLQQANDRIAALEPVTGTYARVRTQHADLAGELLRTQEERDRLRKDRADSDLLVAALHADAEQHQAIIANLKASTEQARADLAEHRATTERNHSDLQQTLALARDEIAGLRARQGR